MNLTEEASENFLLTIGIPTFNREHSLSRTLEDLIKQVRSSKNQSNIEILVSDNCSTDNTRSIVKNYMGVNEDISLSYFKNQSNLGYDGNCNQVFKYAQGCFVWLMSDDDAIDNFAVKKIYNICKKYSNVDVIFINYRLYDSTFTDVISGSDCNLEGENIELTNANSFYDITNFSNSFVSSNVIKASCWRKAYRKEYLGTLWIHFYIVRDILTRGESLVIKTPILKMGSLDVADSRKEKHVQGQYDFYLEAHKNFVRFVHELPEKGYAINLYNKAKEKLLGETLRQIIRNKYTSNSYDIEHLVHTYKWSKVYFGNKVFYWTLIVPILFSPIFFWKLSYNFIASSYKCLKRYGLID
jgi:glycosyltransferase involved in cell wall biosynthesis